MQQHSKDAFDRDTLASPHIQRIPVSYDIELLKVAATHKDFYVRATVREGGRSYPVRRYPSCLSAARPARDRAFYVPRLLLGVGTPRARNSECHSRHPFTHNACRPALHCGRGGRRHKKSALEKFSKALQSGGYLSRAQSSSMSQNYVLAVNTRMCSALPKDYKSSGTPMEEE